MLKHLNRRDSNSRQLRNGNISPVAAIAIIIVVILAIGFFTRDAWMPGLRDLLVAATKTDEKKEADEHEGHDHGAADPNTIEITDQARKSIKLKTEKVILQPFDRKISIPGMIIEQRGRSIFEITAPLTGIITSIGPVEGQAIEPGQKLFTMRLTHEELVQSQSELLKTAEELDVIDREIARLEKISEDGAIAPKNLLDRKYEQQKQKASQLAQRQALLLHGFNDAQIDEILKTRKLLGSLDVTAPPHNESQNDANSHDKKSSVYQVQKINVDRGKNVTAGDTLAVLADHSTLIIEGDAFENEIGELQRAIDQGGSVELVIDNRRQTFADANDKLKIVYVAGKVDPQSRTIHFYVTLPNEMVRDSTQKGTRYISWKYRPGQRVQLLVTVQTMPKKIVLPIDAVAQDGIEAYVFLPNGNQYKRQPVHVEYRDQFSAVIANDGSIMPGMYVVTNGAQQLQLGLKSKSGGPIDPHAGHNH